MVYGLSQFLARGNSCRKIFVSWWLVDVVVINVLARGGSWWLVVARGGLWWIMVACGGSCVVLERTKIMQLKYQQVGVLC